MKLSEAIRLGAMTGPQCQSTFYYRGATCALGAAHMATGHLVHGDLLEAALDAEQAWGLHDERAIPCPAQCSLALTCGFDVITHLNEDHNWTREQIADWVETVERAYETQPQLATVP